MANFDTIKAAIDANINTNGNQAITGAVMNSVLKQMVDSTDTELTELESDTNTKLTELESDTNLRLNFINRLDTVQNGVIDIARSATGWTGLDVFIPESARINLVVTPNAGNVAMYVRLVYDDDAVDSFGYHESVTTLTKTAQKDVKRIEVLCSSSEMVATKLNIAISYDLGLDLADKEYVNNAVAVAVAAASLTSSNENEFSAKVAAGLEASIEIDINRGVFNPVPIFVAAGHYIRISVTPNEGDTFAYIRFNYADGTFLDKSINSSEYITRYFSKNVVGVGVLFDSTLSATKLTVSAQVGNSFGVVYVDSEGGYDEWWGTEDAPLKTIAKAIEITDEDSIIHIKGDFYERINLKQKFNQKRLTIIGAENSRNRIIGGTKIDSATLVSGLNNVYEYKIASFPSENTSYAIWQDTLWDSNTFISESEKHPLQRGYEYRLDATKLQRVGSIQDVENSLEPSFYYDSGSGKLFFSIKTGTSLSSNPVILPSQIAVLSGNDGNVIFKATNIEFCYAHVDLYKCHNAELLECSSKYGANGGFLWGDANGIRFIRCEACGATSYTSLYGDGFSVGTTEAEPTFNKCGTAVMFDCWSHDNHDDGYSDHLNNEITIDGGLFEYNDGGITTSYGSKDIIRNVYARKNTEAGITVYGGSAEGTESLIMGCICEENSPYNYSVVNGRTGNRTKGTFVNCISINATECGYYANNVGTMMRLINCFDIGSPQKKQGTIEIVNAEIVA